jgi:GNAT superfamily N-acetyltransferase
VLSIEPLSARPDARAACIAWATAEWSVTTGLVRADFGAEIGRIVGDPVDEVFVAVQDDAPVGMACLLEHDDIPGFDALGPWLAALVVDPAWRGRGVAAALIAHVEAYAAAGGDAVLYLATDNPALYMTRGWDVLDTARHPTGGVFVMSKRIAPAVPC